VLKGKNCTDWPIRIRWVEWPPSNPLKITFWFPSFPESLRFLLIWTLWDSISLPYYVCSARLEDRTPITIAGWSSVCDQCHKQEDEEVAPAWSCGVRPWPPQHSAVVWALVSWSVLWPSIFSVGCLSVKMSRTLSSCPLLWVTWSILEPWVLSPD
jgi:hypothetical protein